MIYDKKKYDYIYRKEFHSISLITVETVVVEPNILLLLVLT